MNVPRFVCLIALALFVVCRADAQTDSPAKKPAVIAPPDSFFALVRERDREAASAFYKKYIDVGGMPVVAAAEVADQALVRTHEIVTGLLAGRPDIVQSMA